MTKETFQKTRAICGLYLFIFVSMFVSLSFSPLFQNTHYDIDLFIVEGNAWKHGLTPYVNFPDSKGPAFFMIFQLISLIPINQFIATMIFVAGIWTVGAYSQTQFLKTYMTKNRAWFFTGVTLIILITTMREGSINSEYFYVPLICICIFNIIKRRRFVLTGVLSTLIFWGKFLDVTPIVVTFVIFFLYNRKDFKAFGEYLLKILAGVISTSIFVLGFANLQGFLYEAIENYFIQNQKIGSFSFNIVSILRAFENFISTNFSWIHLFHYSDINIDRLNSFMVAIFNIFMIFLFIARVHNPIKHMLFYSFVFTGLIYELRDYQNGGNTGVELYLYFWIIVLPLVFNFLFDKFKEYRIYKYETINKFVILPIFVITMVSVGIINQLHSYNFSFASDKIETKQEAKYVSDNGEMNPSSYICKYYSKEKIYVESMNYYTWCNLFPDGEYNDMKRNVDKLWKLNNHNLFKTIDSDQFTTIVLFMWELDKLETNPEYLHLLKRGYKLVKVYNQQLITNMPREHTLVFQKQ